MPDANPLSSPAKARRRKTLCHLCCEPLTRDDGSHYGYLCHPCAMREHDLLLAGDPDHPDAGWLVASPIALDPYRRREREGS